jgi:phage terminase large subunit-like protein
VRGSVTPRLWTPPLRELTPDTSEGFELIDFADRIGVPFKPWQRWLAIHGGELLPDGRPRFRTVLVIVARQNGKTVKCRVLTLKWMHIDEAPLVLGTSASRDTAKESWRQVIAMASRSPMLAAEYGPTAVRETIGEESFTTLRGSTYRFAAPNRRAGRSHTVHRIILDELREHQTWDTWNAAVKAMTAVADGQTWCITNQGDSRSVVLDSLRNQALEYIETGIGDPRLGLFEWSAPAGSDPTDAHALAMANPQLGDTIKLDSIIGDAMRAKASGGEELATFRTETMCIRANLLDPAIDEDAWRAAGNDDPINLAEQRRRVALCLDVAPDGTHATVVAAAMIEDTVHVEIVAAWNGDDATKRVRNELPDLVAKIKPRMFGWFPNGPAAAIAATLKDRRGPGRRRAPWPPRGVRVAEIVAEQAAVCMGFAEIVKSGDVRHPKDPVLNRHVAHTGKLKRGDTWIFTRDAEHPVDATYAAAGATHLARTMPPPLGPAT